MSKKSVHQDFYFTAEALSGLTKELDRLKEHARPKAVAEVARTAAMGDLSENAAYQEAKTRLRGINSRIFAISEQLKHAMLIDPKAHTDGRVHIGSVVVVESDGNQKTFQILGSEETNPSAGRISHVSPLGSLLMNRKVGDQCTLKTSNKDVIYRILKIGNS